MNKLKQKRILEGLLAAHTMLTYARSNSAFIARGGDHYIEMGDFNRALCEALDLDHNTASSDEFDKAISDAKRRLAHEARITLGWARGES